MAVLEGHAGLNAHLGIGLAHHKDERDLPQPEAERERGKGTDKLGLGALLRIACDKVCHDTAHDNADRTAPEHTHQKADRTNDDAHDGDRATLRHAIGQVHEHGTGEQRAYRVSKPAQVGIRAEDDREHHEHQKQKDAEHGDKDEVFRAQAITFLGGRTDCCFACHCETFLLLLYFRKPEIELQLRKCCLV